ncbi:MAG: hypothetical protein C4521_10165 [Actinobacteria bacterium]|nr:MAG: hypothetical protein C4521_10165 [Actinomycetota bacterium]
MQASRTRLLAIAVLAFAIAAAGLVFLAPAWAGVARGGNTITIGRDEVVNDDVYAAGNTVTVEGTITGDLIAAAQRIVIDGHVEGDVAGAAQTIVINGTVGDDARVAAQAVQVGSEARIGSDLVCAQQLLEVEAGGRVGRDLWAAGSQGLLGGRVGRDVLGAFNGLRIAGTVGRNVRAEVDGQGGYSPSPGTFGTGVAASAAAVRPGLTITEGARVGGNLTYAASRQARIAQGAQISGRVERRAREERPERRRERTAADYILDQIRRLVTLVVVGLLLIWLLPGWTKDLAATIERRWLPSLGWGIVAFFAFIASVLGIFFLTLFLAVLFGVVTLGGILKLVLALGFLSETVLIVAYWIFVAYIAQIVVSLTLGRLVMRHTATGAEPLIPALFVGILIFWVATAIPILGGLLAFVAALFALGALWIWGLGLMRRPREMPPTEVGT